MGGGVTRRRAGQRVELSRVTMSGQVATLFRAYMRAARKFHDANVKDFLMRRGREEFRKHVGETDKAKLAKIVAEGEKSIAMIERTSVVYGMYAPLHKSVLVK